MDFRAHVRTYNVYGSQSTISLLPVFIMQGAADFGPAITALDLTFHFPHSGPPRKTLEESHARFAASRATLPKVTFRRSRGHVDINIASELMDGTEWREQLAPSLELFRNAAVQGIDALGLLRGKLKAADRFDLAAFLAHCERCKLRLPGTDQEFAVVVAYVEGVWRDRAASKSPWEKLDLDWRDFHADARAVLDDPFYWDVVDEFAPHGNDTGSDLFDDYRSWLRLNPQASSIDFLAGLLKRWGIADDASETARRILDEAAVALAFAELKMKAVCAPQVAANAYAALRRQRDEANAAGEWPHREQRLMRLAMLEGKLDG